MPLDHYVSQVHLRQFNAPALDFRKMYAYRKRDKSHFICGSEDVCRLPDGNTTPYLEDPRLVEDFLKIIEPKYNRACADLECGQITPDTVFVLAGFVAYVMACAPAAIRLSVSSLRDTLATEAKLIDQLGVLPEPPPELKGRTLTELLQNGILTYDIDGKYPQAIGIKNIIQTLTHYGNFHWDILINGHSDSPFFTSDFPVAIEENPDPRLVNRIIPLRPHLAIRICPRVELSGRQLGPTFEHFSFSHSRPRRSEIVKLNRVIVRSAEELIFSTSNSPWVASFVRKNADFRAEIDTVESRRGTGYLSIGKTVVRQGWLSERD